MKAINERWGVLLAFVIWPADAVVLTRFVVDAVEEADEENVEEDDELAVEFGVKELNWLFKLELLLLVDVLLEDGDIALWRCKSIWLTLDSCVNVVIVAVVAVVLFVEIELFAVSLMQASALGPPGPMKL